MAKKSGFWDNVFTGVVVGVLNFFIISAIVSGLMFTFFRSFFNDAVRAGKNFYYCAIHK
jgi:hypothetical protein